MNLSRPFILRPVATSLLMLAILMAGLMAWRQLPVAALPQVDYPVIQVYTFYPGASPDVTARTITAPLERTLGQIPGLQHMASTSSAGASVLTLRFALEIDMGVAEQEVQAAMNTASNNLPNDLPAPPIYRKVNPADTPILTLAIRSDTLPLPTVVDMVETRMAQKIARLPGVGMVSLAGGQRPAIRIQTQAGPLANHGLTMEDVRAAIVAANVNQPKGSFDGATRSTMLDANDQIRSVQEYEQLIIAWRDGTPLRLADVATITQGAEDPFLAAWAGTHCQVELTDAQGTAETIAPASTCQVQPAVLINIQRQPGANVIAVADSVHAMLPELTATMPASVQVQVLTDRTESIRASIRGVQTELIFAIGLVVLVTFVFLRTPAATLIPSIAVPLSLVGTFAVMAWLGYSLNNLSLMALTIATGFVVDDAIVMLENIARHRELGEPPLQAALKGAQEIGFTLVSLTVSLVAVLIPLLFMGDVVGRLFHEFAVTLAVAIGISLVVSLTLTPMMAARMLRSPTDSSAHSSASAVTSSPGTAPVSHHDHHQQGDWLDSTIRTYDRMLQWVLAHQALALAAMLATLGATVVLYLAVPKGFFPIQDSGVIQVVTEAPQNISFTAMAERQQQLANALLADADVASLSSHIGVDGNNASLSSGRMLLNLTPHGSRSSSSAIIARLQTHATRVDGITAWFQPVQELSLEDRISGTQYQVSLSTPDPATLQEWNDRMLAHLRAQAPLKEVTSSLLHAGQQAWLEIDRNAAARLGVSIDDVATALQNAFGQRQITSLFTHASQYRIVLEAAAQPTQGASNDIQDALRTVYVASRVGVDGTAQPVPLASVVRVEQRRAPLTIEQQGQFPAATLSFNLAPNYSLGQAIDVLEQAPAAIGMPASVELQLQGATQAFRASLSNTLWLVLAAVVVMYLVLGMLYESAIHPITILSTLPSATVGALLALLIAQRPLDLIAVIGIVLLIGLVKKNGIMMVDFALDGQRHQGLTPAQAIHRAALLRFRPILMTTLAALFGAIPLMLATGSGAELRQPLGIVMVGGLIMSQLLTLFTTPVVYLLFDRLGHRPRTPAPAPAASSI